ncbi:MAG: RES domain-containing protein [Alphaproteobacteria bacterium]|nr:RES domain-containing protein [Alphaproteobacteria bacterium]
MACQFKGSLTAFRIADKRHSLFDGIGAALLGARWNSPGLRVIYAALSYAGAMLEKLAQSGRVGDIPKTHQAIKIFIPEAVQIEEVKDEDIKGWKLPDLIKSRQYGDRWIQEKRTAVLMVPAVIAVEEKNILINPEHPQFSMIKASEPQEVVWDPRLFHP